MQVNRYSYPLWVLVLLVEGVRLDIATVTSVEVVGRGVEVVGAEVVGMDGLSEDCPESAIRRKQQEHLQRRVQPRVSQSLLPSSGLKCSMRILKSLKRN